MGQPTGPIENLLAPQPRQPPTVLDMMIVPRSLRSLPEEPPQIDPSPMFMALLAGIQGALLSWHHIHPDQSAISGTIVVVSMLVPIFVRARFKKIVQKNLPKHSQICRSLHQRTGERCLEEHPLVEYGGCGRDRS
jgi:hypothetical protein